MSRAALVTSVTLKYNVAIHFEFLRNTHTHTHYPHLSLVSPLLLRTAKSYNCTGLLTSLPLTLLALADTLTHTCIHTHFLIGEAGHTWFVTCRERSSDSWSIGVIFVCLCVHIRNTLDMCIKSTGKVNKVLSREITLGSQCPYISPVSCETGNEDRDRNEVLSQQHQSCSQHYHSNGI